MKRALDYLSAFVVFALVVAGLVGLGYHLFRDGGWVASLAASVWESGRRSPFLVVSVITGVAALAWLGMRDDGTRRNHGMAATLVFYTLIAAGLFFLGRLAFVGTM